MEHPSHLEENLRILCEEIKKVDDLRAEIESKGNPGEDMKKWLEIFERFQTEVAQTQTDFQEIQSAPIDLRTSLNLEIIEGIKLMRLLKEEADAISESMETLLNQLSSDRIRSFTHSNLRSYTSNFTQKVGQGGFGQVYKGQFPNGVHVVVKVLVEKGVGEETFIAEVGSVCKTYHRNLIKLHGYCFERDMWALVYDYMENGSLDTILYENNTDIEWEKLYNIAIETAKGVAYLHDGCCEQIIHHDLKPANILLDSNLSPKVTDFGLAKLMKSGDASHYNSTGMRGTLDYAAPDASHYTSTGMRGTLGYAAPETWTQSSKVTYKCDVYSFGIMLFEILGRKNNGHGEEWFPKQVWNKFEDGKFDEIITECGISEKDKEKAKILAMVALWCTQFTPETRPSMSTVFKMLENEIVVKNPPDPMYC